MYKIKLQSNPNNEIRVTLYPIRNKGKYSDEDLSLPLPSPSSESEPSGERSEDFSLPSPILDIRSEFRTVCSAMSSKRTEFGHYAKTRIMRAAGAMDREDACPWHYTFLTATLPSNDEWAKWAIAEYAPWIIDTIKSWLSKRSGSRLEFYVWEHQNRGALHFHWCIYTPDESLRVKLAEEFRLEWCRILDGVEKKSGISMWGRFAGLSPTAQYCVVQVKVETIRKSVAAYMAGYCGVGKDKHEKDTYIPYYPKRWYGVSRHLSALVQEHSQEETIEYPNYRSAKLNFDEFNRKFEQDEIKGKIWCHTVGRGETGVHYHNPKIQGELWQSKNPMIFKQQSHPNTLSLINQWVRLASTCSELTRSSQLFREICSKQPVESLLDGLYRDSSRRGSLHVFQVRAVEILYTALNSRLNLPPSLIGLSRELQDFAMTVSANYSQLRWDQHGWLVLTSDLEHTVDSLRQLSDNRTTGDEEGEGVSGDGSSGLVPGELTETHQFTQLTLE